MAPKKPKAAAAADDQLTIAIPTEARKPKVVVIPRDLIHPDPDQPRVEAGDELRASIATNGILQPITVRPHPDRKRSGQFMIVDGERRWRGSEGVLAELPAIVRHDMADEVARLRTQLVANTGKPLTPLEEARAFATMAAALGSIAAVARELGRPASTISERLALLELGPWIPLLESGLVPLSYAVRVLLPLRKAPAAVHEAAVARVLETATLEQVEPGEPVSDTVEDFAELVEAAVRPAAYPLGKSDRYWEPQPTFDTSKHDRDCKCGRPTLKFGGMGGRAHCLNPEWWKPRDAEGKKKQAAAQAGQRIGADRARITVLKPTPGIPEIAHDGYGAPKGVIRLTSREGTWQLGWRADDEQNFDPALLDIDPAQLVRVVDPAGMDWIGTKDTAAVVAGRLAWRERWAGRELELASAFREELDAAAFRERVMGPGSASVLSALLLSDHSQKLVDLATTMEIPVSESMQGEDYVEDDILREWVAGLAPEQCEALLSAFAAVTSTEGIDLPARAVAREASEAMEVIRRQVTPWTSEEAVAALAASDDDDDEEEEEEEEETLACTKCGCTEDAACEGGCYWVTTNPPVCSACEGNDAAVDADIDELEEPLDEEEAAPKHRTRRAPDPRFMQPLQPSDALAAIVGPQPLARTEVTKKIWDYIRVNRLQDQKNRRMILADEALFPILGKQSISMFEMTKAINQHLTEVGGGQGKAVA